MITVFVYLIQLSLPSFEQKNSKNKAEQILKEKTNNFISTLTDNEKRVLAKLPCDVRSISCENPEEIRNKLKESYSDPLIKSFLLLNAKGVEVFSNRRIERKYENIISETNETGVSFIIENLENKNNQQQKIIILKKLSSLSSDKNLENKIILVAFDESLQPSKFQIIIFVLLASLPILISLIGIYFLSRKFNEEKKESDEKNAAYILQIEDLRRENVQQSQFLTNFTHELRTPLNSIIGFSGLLKDQTLGPLGNPEYLKYSSDINMSGLHLLSLINDILDYSKSEVGKLKVNITEVEVIKIIKQSLSLVAPRASESKLDLLQSFASDYFVVRLDPKRFKQIMLNLLSNSVKFTPEGGSVMVSVFPDIKGEKIFIEVKDTGVGIDEKDIPTVMSLFGQVETNLNRKYEGTGIGLPFAKKLTTLMGGSFDLQSKVGVGTRITLTFDYNKDLNLQYAEMLKQNS
jgi:signal transduction histidine kinase